MDKKVVLREKLEQSTVLITQYEVDLMELLSNGLSNKEIASMWGLSSRTIEAYRQELMFKLDCKRSLHLMAIFFRKGLIK